MIELARQYFCPLRYLHKGCRLTRSIPDPPLRVCLYCIESGATFLAVFDPETGSTSVRPMTELEHLGIPFMLYDMPYVPALKYM